MGIQLEQIKDPKLRSRIIESLIDGEKFRDEIKKAIPHDTETDRQLQGAQPEQAVCHEPLEKVQGEEKGARRISVRFSCFRSRLLDPDNLCCKSLLDGLRYSGLIPGDEQDKIELSITQEKCDKKDERTEIAIDY